jgi:uncharacterized membrane protein YeaQ/YmgE (transglycosylase-associated protein family)
MPHAGLCRYGRNMYFLLWFVALGIVGGWSSGKVMAGNSPGRVMDVLMGLGGAVVTGITAGSLVRLGLWGFIYSSVCALLAAVLLTALIAFMNGRKYA